MLLRDTAEKGPIVAGHQPNFFPWFGYFEKLLKCDIFIFSDDVKFPKQCYVNRVEIPIGSRPSYFTLPVLKGNDTRIADKLYMKDEHTLRNLLKTIQFNLGGLTHYTDIVPVMEEFERAYRHYQTIADLNIHMISELASLVGIRRKTLRGTTLGLEPYRKTERLIRRCRLVDSNIYLCGQGADDYQDEKMFRREGVELRHIDYTIGQTTLGEDLKYSILFGMAKHGIAKLHQAVRDFDLKRAAL